MEAALDRFARQHQLSRDAAVARLLAERVPDRPAPRTPDGALAALLEAQPLEATAVGELGSRRQEAVRDTLKRAGVQGERLTERQVVQREGGESEVAMDVLDPDTPRPSKMREVLRRIGMPLKDSER